MHPRPIPRLDPDQVGQGIATQRAGLQEIRHLKPRPLVIRSGTASSFIAALAVSRAACSQEFQR